MGNKLPRFQKAPTLVLGAATLTLLWLPGPAHAQTMPTQPKQMAPTDDVTRGDAMNFDRFLDQHREIAEQVRKDPSLLDSREFVRDHPALQTYFQNNQGVRDQIRQDPNAFMRQADRDNRDADMRDRDAAGQDRDADHRDVANDRGANGQYRDADRRDADRRDAMNFDRFLDSHREIGEQVRKDPSLLDDRNFVDNHPALQAYLHDNPGVRDQLRQDPNTFMHQADQDNRDLSMRDHDPMHDRMEDFGGFLGSHSDIQKDLSRDPSVVKNHDYVQDHAELDAYLNAHPDVRNELMANPQDFVHGAQQYSNGSGTGTVGGAGMSGRGTGTTGTSAGTPTGSSAGTPTNPTATPHPTKPNM